MSGLYIFFTKLAGLFDGSDVNLPNKDLPEDSSGISAVFNNALSVIFAIMGVICVLIITIAGIQYVLSGGDSQKVAKAKNTIIYALIGLVIAISAFIIVNFVLDRSGL